jgi:hypothetical protein
MVRPGPKLGLLVLVLMVLSFAWQWSQGECPVP